MDWGQLGTGLMAMGAGFSGRDPSPILQNYHQALLDTQRKAAISDLLGRMNISPQQKALLDTMPVAAEQSWLLQEQQRQRAVAAAQSAAAAKAAADAKAQQDYQSYFAPSPIPNVQQGPTVAAAAGQPQMQPPAMDKAWVTRALADPNLTPDMRSRIMDVYKLNVPAPTPMPTTGAPAGYMWKDPNNPQAGVMPIPGFTHNAGADPKLQGAPTGFMWKDPNDHTQGLNPIPGYTSTSNIQTPQDTQDIKSVAAAIESGQYPPVFTRMYKHSFPLIAQLTKDGFDTTKAMQDWNATSSYLKTINGTQQVRLRQSVGLVDQALGNVQTLADQWNAGNYPVLNAANLTAAMQGVKGTPQQILATKLYQQIHEIIPELAVVYMGGNAPTDQGFKLAQTQLSGNWSKPVFDAAIKQLRQNLQYRKNSLNLAVAGIDSNMYGANLTQPYQEPSAGNTGTPVPGQAPSAAPTTQAPAAVPAALPPNAPQTVQDVSRMSIGDINKFTDSLSASDLSLLPQDVLQALIARKKHG